MPRSRSARSNGRNHSIETDVTGRSTVHRIASPYEQLKAVRRALRFTRHARQRIEERAIREIDIAAAVLFGVRPHRPRVHDDRKEFRCVLTATVVERLKTVVAVVLRAGLVVTIGADNRVVTVWSVR